MQSSAVKKHDHFGEQVEANANDNVVEYAELTEVMRKSIAREAEEACHLAGNNNSPDFDLFEKQYGLSCFA